MRLLVTTPTALVVEARDVAHVRAEDDTGAFGIEPRHARFLTTLPISVLSWRDAEAAEHHVAVRGGVLIVEDGDVEVATRQAIRDDDLDSLAVKVEQAFLQDTETEETARTAAHRLHLATMRQIQRVVDAARGTGAGSRIDVDRGVGAMRETGNHEGRDRLRDAIRRRQERRDRWKREGERSLGQNLAMVGALGWLVVVPTLLGVLAGSWLDARFGSGVTFTGALIFLGAAFGFYLAWKRMNEK